MTIKNASYATQLDDLLHNAVVLLQMLKSRGDADDDVERLMSYRDHLQARIAAGETWEVNF